MKICKPASVAPETTKPGDVFVYNMRAYLVVNRHYFSPIGARPGVYALESVALSTGRRMVFYTPDNAMFLRSCTFEAS